MNEPFWDWARYVNAGCALVVFFLICAGMIARWDEIPLRFRRIIPWVALTYFIIAVGSVELARAETYVDPGLRVGLLFLNLVGLIVSFLYGIGDRHYEYDKRWWVFYHRDKHVPRS